MMEDKTLYVVHSVDTEGPLYQSPKATLLRVNEIYGTDFPTDGPPALLRELVDKLGRQEIPTNGLEAEIGHFLSTARFLSDHRDYAAAIQEATAAPTRSALADPQGGPHRYSWFVLDNTATFINPRRRLVGYSQVYRNLLESVAPSSLELDGFYWHYHQMRRDQHPFVKESSFFADGEYDQILCRHIIECRTFPAAYRAGYCLERWDANLWLENWIPFDFSNQAASFDYPVAKRIGLEHDFWLRAPADWSHYHPDSRDVERPGNLRRTMFRSLCIRTRLYAMSDDDVHAAFRRADSGQPTVLSGFSHDFRALRPEAEILHEKVAAVARHYPDVTWRKATAVQAAAGVLGLGHLPPLELDLRVEDGIVYAASNQAVFGSEPYLAIKTVDHRFYTENFVKIDDTSWGCPLRYPQTVQFLGIGACNPAGDTATCLLECRAGAFHPVRGTGYWAGSPE
ncbi:hypothetical protein [Desulfolutivibrio sulfoxidireducens]|uniref:hypothetical protein n=1 Tax=Desulfolutivibrio sulfoxidireducens TaxID=2773299 RepID=UPI00159DA485|nr:hypothetical protein [Desulfolutivibrio sulfoxidireducens]QLA20626.1 hypothetical protein GD604_13350 [Desulfolutivibrio sulfoxidireducens]